MKRGKESLGFGKITASQRKPGRSYPVVTQAIALVLYTLGAMFTLHACLGLPQSPSVFFSALLFPLLFAVIYNLPDYKRYFLLGAAALLLLFTLLMWKDILVGAQVFRNNLIAAVNQYYHMKVSVPRLPSLYQYEYHRGAVTLLAMAFYLLSIMLGYAVVRAKSWFVLAVASAPFLWMAVNLQESPPSGMTIFPFLLSLLCVLAMRYGAGYWPRQKEEGMDFAPRGRKKRSFFAVNSELKQEAVMKNGLTVLSCALVVMIVISIFAPSASYRRSEIMQVFDRDPWEFLEQLGLYQMPKTVSNMGVGGGVLGNVDRVEYDNDLHLRLTPGERKEPMYLRGFVGSNYQGDRWEDPVGWKLSAYDDYFGFLSQVNRNPQTLSKNFAARVEQGLIGEKMAEGTDGNGVFAVGESDSTPLRAEQNTITVENVAANRNYLYTPYNQASDQFDGNWEEENFKGDLGMVPTVNYPKYSKYEFTYYSYNPGTQDFMLNFGIPYAEEINQIYRSTHSDQRQLELEDEYAAMVYDTYARASSNESLRPMREEYTPELLQTLGLGGYINRVKRDLQSIATYDLEPGKTPDGQDFVSYFLYENKRGYCMHFASAAVLMFRSAGIPARYAEGYVVTESDYDNAYPSGIVPIYDRSAHAWPEIYVQPFGWIPIEVTPGFSSGSVANPDYGSSSEEISSEETSSEALSSEEASSETESSFSSEILSSDTSEVHNGGVSGPVTGSSTIVTGPSDSQAGFGMRLFLVFLGLLALLLIAALILAGRRRRHLLRRRRAVHQRDRRKAVLALYGYLLQLLEFQGIELETGEMPEEFAVRAERACGFLPGGSFVLATKLAQEARFSQHEISSESAHELERLALRLDERIYGSLRSLQRFRYKYIENLR